MKLYLYLLILTSLTTLNAQTAFKNFGNIQMHDDAKIGFHTDMINDGPFVDNLGFTGFYSTDEPRNVSGSSRAIFNDVEVDAINNLELETSLGVRNELLFMNGKVVTPRDNPEVSLDFINHNFYVGEGDDRHTDGYASVTGREEFAFPIGDNDRLRPMIIPEHSTDNYFNGAYFYEDPNLASTFSAGNFSFSTEEKQNLIKHISHYEYWDLDGTDETVVTLTWDRLSAIEDISPVLNFLRVVGWSKKDNKWVNLGASNTTGDLDNGTITSEQFIPNDFEIITIGSMFSDIELGGNNYIISPNDDDKNDALSFDGLELYAKNELHIFNRWGNTVYQTSDYKNNWEGLSTGRATLNVDDKLPAGTYFYVLKLGDDSLDKEIKGWVYINY